MVGIASVQTIRFRGAFLKTHSNTEDIGNTLVEDAVVASP